MTANFGEGIQSKKASSSFHNFIESASLFDYMYINFVAKLTEIHLQNQSVSQPKRHF